MEKQRGSEEREEEGEQGEEGEGGRTLGILDAHRVVGDGGVLHAITTLLLVDGGQLRCIYERE